MKEIISRPIFLMFIMTLFICSGCAQAESPSTGTAADFTLETIDGEKIVLSELLKQKKAVLVFWATWCPYCVKEISHIERFYAQNKGKWAVISIDVGEGKAKVAKFVQRKKITYPVALDTDSQVARLYNVRGVPTIVAVDRDSQIIYYGHSIKEMLTKTKF